MPKGCKYIYKGKTYTRESFMALLASGEYENILAEQDQSQRVETRKEREVVDTVEALKSKSSVGGKFNVNLFANLTDEQGVTKLDKLREEGYIIDNADVFSFAGSDNVFTMVPDNKMVGDLSYGEDSEGKSRVVLQGNGGIYYAVKFNEDGTFWASTPKTAATIIKQVNSAIDENGSPVYVVVQKGSDRKVLSSVDGMMAVVDTIAYMVEDGDIPVSVFRKAMSESLKKNTDRGEKYFPLNVSGKQLHNSVKEFFMAAEGSSFEERKNVVLDFVRNVFDRSNKESINFDNISANLGIPVKNKEAVIDHFGRLQQEGFMFDVPSASAYAVIEIPSKLKLEDESIKNVNERRHVAYPGIMKTEDGQRVKVHMLKDRLNYLEFLTDASGTPLSSFEDRVAQGKAGRGNIPWVKAGIKTKSSKGIGKFEPLPGAPKIEGATGPDPNLVSVADNYAKKFGIPFTRQAEYVTVDVDRAKRIADEYEKMKHDPKNPKVLEAFNDLIRQTKDQYDALTEAGYEFSFFDGDTDPYKGNPSEAMRDLRKNKKMAVYGTYAGYGTEGITGAKVEDNPMLQDTGLKWKDQNGKEQPVTANDLFRAVHDAFGHGLEGAGFRARGEENAWQAHVRLFTGPAVAAITTETRGQNSWLNYGPFGEKNRTAMVEDTIFAEQKTGLMPEWTWTEGKAEAMPEATQDTDTLKDVESTAKALEAVDSKKIGVINYNAKRLSLEEREKDDKPIVKDNTPLGTLAKNDMGDAYELQLINLNDLTPKETGQNLDLVEKYVNWKKEGNDFPPITAIRKVDGTLIIVDGHNRYRAAKLNGDKTIRVWVGLNDGNAPMSINKAVSEAYHAAKADGSNPELVQAVENLLSQPNTLQKGVESQAITDPAPLFKKSQELFEKISDAAGGSKKRSLAEERRKFMDENPDIKFIDENMAYIYKQIEDNNLGKKEGNCPL